MLCVGRYKFLHVTWYFVRIPPKFLFLHFCQEKINVKKFDKSNCVRFCSMVVHNMVNNLSQFMQIQRIKSSNLLLFRNTEKIHVCIYEIQFNDFIIAPQDFNLNMFSHTIDVIMLIHIIIRLILFAKRTVLQPNPIKSINTKFSIVYKPLWKIRNSLYTI